MIKNVLIFIAGMITMLVIVVLLGIAINLFKNNGYPGLTIFEQEGKCINTRQLEVMQTLEPDMALSHAKIKTNTIYDSNELLVLLIGDEKTNYYDDQKINVPKGMCAKQIGTYQYEAEIGTKTVPVVTIK